jgi:hypothetical protein
MAAGERAWDCDESGENGTRSGVLGSERGAADRASADHPDLVHIEVGERQCEFAPQRLSRVAQHRVRRGNGDRIMALAPNRRDGGASRTTARRGVAATAGSLAIPPAIRKCSERPR